MSTDLELSTGGETIDLQQQVARLQALLEASRQVHATIHEEEVLETGAAHRGARAGDGRSGLCRTGLAYGSMPADTRTAPASSCHLSAGRPRRQADDGIGGRVTRRHAN